MKNITSNKTAIEYLASTSILISNLPNISNISKIYNWDVNGYVSSWVFGDEDFLQGFLELEPNKGYLIISNSGVTSYPYTLYTENDIIPSQGLIDAKIKLTSYFGASIDILSTGTNNADILNNTTKIYNWDVNGNVSSWVFGDEDFLQGFGTLDNSYVYLFMQKQPTYSPYTLYTTSNRLKLENDTDYLLAENGDYIALE